MALLVPRQRGRNFICLSLYWEDNIPEAVDNISYVLL